MICVICRKRDVRPPKACDQCGRLACPECMEKAQLPPGQYVGKNLVFTEKNGTFRLSNLCKVCKAELILTEGQ